MDSPLNTQFLKNLTFALLVLAACSGICCAELSAQQGYQDFFQVQNQPTPPPIPDRQLFYSAPPQVTAPPPVHVGQPEIIYSVPPMAGQPGVSFQQPPIPAQSNPFPYFPYQQPSPIQSLPVQTAPAPYAPYTPYQAPDPYGSGVQPVYPGYAPYNNPTYQGTNSNWLPSIDWNKFRQDYMTPFLERPRARQTYVYGRSKEDKLGINDIEIATTLTMQNFMGSQQPLRLTPGFIFHFWNGPNSIANPGYDLPPHAYSIMLTFDHLTNPANQVGLESNFTVGYYSDFENHSSDGIRFTGRILGWTRLNHYTIGKLGIEYFDRVNLKMLPAFGVYMTPNADTKIDLLFPKSKLSHRIPNLNDTEAWVYVGAEYGGGSWVIERMGGMDDQVDINDVRAFAGIEWMGPLRVTGFFEAGYVFEREIRYRSAPGAPLELSDSFMIRSGFAF